MIEPGRVAAVLLAAGLSRRFGAADKLAVSLGGRPLARHAADMLGAIPFAQRIAVTSGAAFDGFATVRNPRPEEGLASSLKLGIGAVSCAVDAVLVALADMPFVPASHIEALLARHRDDGSLIASRANTPCPPALFGRDWFARLLALEGDRGAGPLLREAEVAPCDPSWLRDIDTPEDLARTGSG